ncbi:class I tRNA ligase family protein [Bacillus pacificus]|nr:class I tRNA ligase family protein [Bacillus pacificus]
MTNLLQKNKYEYKRHAEGTRLHASIDLKPTPHVGLMATPNANGELHLGHTFVALSEDVWARLNQLNGKDSRLITGADHGGHSLVMVAKKNTNQTK